MRRYSDRLVSVPTRLRHQRMRKTGISYLPTLTDQYYLLLLYLVHICTKHKSPRKDVKAYLPTWLSISLFIGFAINLINGDTEIFTTALQSIEVQTDGSKVWGH